MKNTIKNFVDSREISVYKFRQQTGISQATAYRLYNNPEEIPRKEVLEAICRAFRIQPGEILMWEGDGSGPPEPGSSDRQPNQEREAIANDG